MKNFISIIISTFCLLFTFQNLIAQSQVLEECGFDYKRVLLLKDPNYLKLEIESEMKSKWIDVVSMHTSDTSMIPNKNYGLDVSVNRDDAWYVERKSLNEKRFEDICGGNHQDLQGMFNNKSKSISREDLEKIVVDYHDSIEERQPSPTETKLVNRVISVLKTIYSSCLNRYRVIFQVNKQHHLFQHLQN